MNRVYIACVQLIQFGRTCGINCLEIFLEKHILEILSNNVFCSNSRTFFECGRSLTVNFENIYGRPQDGRSDC